MKQERYDDFYRYQPKKQLCESHKKPLYYIVSLFDKHYFVNNGFVPILSVNATRNICSVNKCDGKIVNLTQTCSYQNVNSKEAVLIHKDFFLKDYKMTWEVTVSLSSGKFVFCFEPCVELRENILMWETFETPANIVIKKDTN